MVISEKKKAEFWEFFREMDSGGVAASAPENVISISTSPYVKPSKKEDSDYENTN